MLHCSIDAEKNKTKTKYFNFNRRVFFERYVHINNLFIPPPLKKMIF